MISTLRKKFYVSSSSFREHYFDFESNNAEMLKVLDSLKTRMKKIGGRRKIDRANSSATQKPPEKLQKIEKSKVVVDSPTKRKVSLGSIASSTSNSNKQTNKKETQNSVSKLWRY